MEKKELMKLLWSGDLRKHTLHAEDWCQAAWKASMWCLSRDRPQIDAEAGVKLPYFEFKDASNISIEAEHPLMCPRNVTPTAGVFNVVDDSDTDQYVNIPFSLPLTIV